MKSNFKKVMSLVLTVLMVMTVVPFTSFATAWDCAEQGHKFDGALMAREGKHAFWCSECGDFFGYMDGETPVANEYQDCYSVEAATCKDKAVCDVCEREFGELSATHGATKVVTGAANLKSEATCTAPAIYYYVCKVCNGNTTETFEFGDVNPDGHDYDTATPNTGDLAGTHSALCSLCSESILSATCADAEPNVIAPTCTTAGKTVNKCDACGYEWDSAPVDALGHDYTEKLIDEAHLKSAATCTAKATYWYDCAVCDANAKDDAQATDAYCEDGEMLPHDFTATVAEEKYIVSAANCQQKAVYYKSCTVCGLSSKDTAGVATFEGAMGTHTWGTYTYNNDATCGVDGTETAPCTITGCTAVDTRTKAGTALEHVFTEQKTDEAHLKRAATCTAKATYWKECSRENCEVLASDETIAANYYEAGEFAAHAFTEAIKNDAHLKAAATCVTKAVYWYDCASCDAIASDATVAANYYTDEEGETLPHVYNVEKVEEKYLAVAATCSTAAIYYKSCACGDSGVNSTTEAVFKSGNPLGHDNETIPGKDPTCTEKGYTESIKCKRCGTYSKPVVERPATGHKEYVSVAKVEATCTKAGCSEERKCAVCGQLQSMPSISSPALGHTDANGDEICDRAGCGTIITGDGADCSCLCHQTGLMKIVYFLVSLIWKLIGANKYCDCGIEHY